MPSRPQFLEMVVDVEIDRRLESLNMASGRPVRAADDDEEEVEEGRWRTSHDAVTTIGLSLSSKFSSIRIN